MYIKEAVVRRVKGLCEERAMTLNQLATLSGMTPSTLYSMVDPERRDISILTIKKICDGLDLTVVEFFQHDLFFELDQEVR